MARAFIRIALCLAAALWALDLTAARPAQPSAGSASLDQAILKGFTWRSIGPPRGGRSIAVAASKAARTMAYFGATGGGLWKTTDAVRPGRRSPTDRSPAPRSAPSPWPRATPTSSSSAWASRASAATSCRATASTSPPTPARRGRTSASGTRRHISKIRIHPTNPDIVFVAGFGQYGVPNDERGVFKSTDGGKTLAEGAVPRQQDRRPSTCRSTGNNPNVIYAALWEAYPQGIPDVERRTGQRPVQVHRRRRDTGPKSRAIPGMPTGVVGRIGVCRLGRRLEPRVCARRKRERRAARLRQRRRHLDDGQREPQYPAARVLLHACRRRPEEQDTVYLLNVERVQSTDGGKTITGWGGGTHGDYHDLWIDPDDPQHMVIANDGGGAVSRTGRRGGLVGAGFPDGAVLPRRHDDASALPRVRRAAGRQHRVRLE